MSSTMTTARAAVSVLKNAHVATLPWCQRRSRLLLKNKQQTVDIRQLQGSFKAEATLGQSSQLTLSHLKVIKAVKDG